MNLINAIVQISFLLIFNCFSANGQNAIETTNNVTTTIATVSQNSTGCPDGSLNPPKCTECPENHQRIENKCVLTNETQSKSPSGFRRLFLLFIGCLLTIVLVASMIMVYGRVVSENRHNRRSVPTNLNGNSSNADLGSGQRIRHFFQGFGLGKGIRLNPFSRSTNNANGGNRANENSRTHLSENPDEALLFDDPFADSALSGGLHGSSSNPYKSLTLSVA